MKSAKRTLGGKKLAPEGNKPRGGASLFGISNSAREEGKVWGKKKA